MDYILYYKGIELGIITQLSEDFPNLFGHFKPFEKVNSDFNLLSEYIKYSIQADILMNSNEEEWQAYTEAEEHKFIELIESEDWEVIDENKNTHKILIPNFCNKNQIVWRWNV